MAKRAPHLVCTNSCDKHRHRRIRRFADAADKLLAAAWDLMALPLPPAGHDDSEAMLVLRAGARAAFWTATNLKADLEGCCLGCCWSDDAADEGRQEAAEENGN